ncbi:MAG TPA: hypothetical protein VNA24_35865 [Hyalangium sp.]|nr:hypothetical protein [Hyalangium sp.]
MRNMYWGRYALVLMMVMGAAGCAHHKETGYFERDRTRMSQADDFTWLLMRAGVEPEVLPSTEEITVQQAEELRLWIRLMLLDGHMASYGPRKTVEFLMEEIIAGGVPVARSVLSQQLVRFRGRFVLRPDAYVADALRGKPLRSVGPLRVERGAIVAASLKLDTFYMPQGSSFLADPGLAIHARPSTANPVSTAQR